MTDGDTSRPGSSSESGVVRAMAAAARVAAAVLLLGGIASFEAGCDSSSTDSDQPFPEFEGRWAVDVDSSSISCQQAEVGTQPISPWSNPPSVDGQGLGVVTLEAGVLTDLIETSTECQFTYNVNPKVAEASVPDPDPYTGSAPSCVMALPRADGSHLVLASRKTQPLTFQLAMPVKGMAQVAYITGAADATVKVTDLLGDLQTYEGCTFVAQVKLHKIAKP